MLSSPSIHHRRTFLRTAAAASVTLGMGTSLRGAEQTRRPSVCAFIKFVQSWSYSELAERIAEAGFDGIEATIRKNGYIEPEAAPDELPKLVEALRRHGLDITIMTSDILSPDQPHAEAQLRVATELGIPQYRLGFYRYDLNRSVLKQLAEIQPAVNDLATFNGELGIQGIYQNHSGASFVGAPIWDVHHLLRDIPVAQIGVAFDIRHATIEGGLAWPLHYDLMRPHLGAIYAKDYQWDGRKAQHVPLGTGRVDPKFFTMVRESGYTGPYSLHVEYLPHASAAENYDALKRDLKQLHEWLAA